MKRLALNGQWELCGGTYQCVGTIPGSVYSFLLSNKLINNPYYRDNEDLALSIMDNDFTFSRNFDFHNENKAQILLCCDGLDTICDLYINGNFVAHTENMHRSYKFDVTNLLTNGQNLIEIKIASPTKYVKEKHLKKPNPESYDACRGHSYLRKANCMFGWDWGPRLPDAGIWKDIYLLENSDCRILDFSISQRHENGKVFVTPVVKTEGVCDVNITATSPDGKVISLTNNRETEIESPKLWWPRGYGEQALYTFKATTSVGFNQDVTEKRIGLRTVRLVRNPDKYGESFYHEVNGVGIFAMGGNYIPEDNIFSRITKERTHKLITDCYNANFNTIRVWGGGFYPHDYFFDICDELGILVFLDMMAACQVLIDDKNFQDGFAKEIEENLLRLRHHACLAVICGNNEIEWGLIEWWKDLDGIDEWRKTYVDFYENRVAEISSKICPQIPYITSSPTTRGVATLEYSYDIGDSHYWDVWCHGESFYGYRKHLFRYLSEFDFQSLPALKTIESFTEPKDRYLNSRIMEKHQRHADTGNKMLLDYLLRNYLLPNDFATLIYATQILQATAMRTAVEHLRSNRGICMGALYWQINDIWPVASWSSIDGCGRYKALHYEARRFYNPILISCKETGEHTHRESVNLQKDYFTFKPTATLSVTNDTPESVSGKVVWTLSRTDGTIVKSGSENIVLNPLSAITLETLEFTEIDIYNTYFSYRFIVNDTVLSSGSRIFTNPKYFNFCDPQLKAEINGNEITITADSYAQYVEIYGDDDMILSDNFFDMSVGKKTVTLLEGTAKNIKLRSVYNIR